MGKSRAIKSVINAISLVSYHKIILRKGSLLEPKKHLKDEIYFPGPTIDRANRSRWEEEGNLTIGERAKSEVTRLLAEAEPVRLSDDVRKELTRLMTAEANKLGMDKLPELN